MAGLDLVPRISALGESPDGFVSYGTNDHHPAETYAWLYDCYNFFNQTLFAKTLPNCLLTFQRKLNMYGYFSKERFELIGDAAEITDEIALNPAHFKRPTFQVLSTLVHEMVHLEQHHFGNPGRGGYHNREWARMMRRVGLIPSNTGKPGGKETGDRVGHYIEEGGAFERACHAYMRTNAAVLYQDRAYLNSCEGIGSRNGARGDDKSGEDKSGDENWGGDKRPFRVGDQRERARLRKAASKTRFTCSDCEEQTAWAKASARLICGDCGARMDAQPP